MDRVPSVRAAVAQQLRSNRTGGVLIRLLMAAVAAWYSSLLGAFRHSAVESVLVVIGLAGVGILMVTAWSDKPPRWSFPIAALVCILGGVISATTNFTGWFLFGLGCMVLVGRSQSPLPLAWAA